MVTERTIINALIIGASFFLAPFVISESLTVDYLPAFFFFMMFALLVAFFYFKETMCIVPLLCAGIPGTWNILPLPFQTYHLVSILLILYYFTGYVIIRQKPIKLGKTKFLWPMLILTLVLLYHNHSLSVRSMGGDTEGAKPALLIYLMVFAYFCGINVPTPSTRFLSKIPLLFVIMTALGSIPYVVTTFVPSLAPILYRVITSVNVDTYIESQVGNSDGGIGRLSAFGALGGALQLYLLCYYPIGTWLRPERWWVAGLSLVCVALTIASGYRSTLVGFGSMFMIGVWCYYSWRALFLPVGLFIAAVLFLVASSNGLVQLPENKLPMIAQRTLSFMPGEWSSEAIESSKSSNDFRNNIQNLYIKEYLDKSPLIGNGFSINTKVFDHLNDILKGGGGGAENGMLQARTFIEGKLFHTGWISVYDCVGIIGSLAFVVLGWNEIRMAGRFVFGPISNRRSSLFPVYIWILCNVVTMMFTFFTVFGDFGGTFMSMCLYGILLSQLSDIKNTSDVPVALREHKGQGEFTGLKGAPYGYHSRI
jgi:hypothetical protein